MIGGNDNAGYATLAVKGRCKSREESIPSLHRTPPFVSTAAAKLRAVIRFNNRLFVRTASGAGELTIR